MLTASWLNIYITEIFLVYASGNNVTFRMYIWNVLVYKVILLQWYNNFQHIISKLSGWFIVCGNYIRPPILHAFTSKKFTLPSNTQIEFSFSWKMVSYCRHCATVYVCINNIWFYIYTACIFKCKLLCYQDIPRDFNWHIKN